MDGREFHRRRHTSRRDLYYQWQAPSMDGAPRPWMAGISMVFCSGFSGYLTLLTLLTLLLLLNYCNYSPSIITSLALPTIASIILSAISFLSSLIYS